MLRFQTHRLAIVSSLVLMALIPMTAFAASRVASESISGVETGIPTACGSGESMSSFAGAARGTINGVWSASVCHAGLSIAPGPPASISGGSFRVSGIAGWRYVSISDAFDNGTIYPGTETKVVLNGVGTCTQVFGLSIGKIDTSISFTATLVHYGAFFADSCHVLSATLSGAGQIRY